MRVESADKGENENERLPCSPLGPLKSSLCLLRTLGLPLRLGGEDGGHVTNRKAFSLVLLLPIALDVALVVGKGWVLYQGLPDTGEILELFKKKGLKNWDTFRDVIWVGRVDEKV